MSADELRRQTEEKFGAEPGFQPIDEFYAAQRRRLGE